MVVEDRQPLSDIRTDKIDGAAVEWDRHRARSTSPMKLRLESRIHYRFPSAVCPLPHSKPQFTG